MEAYKRTSMIILVLVIGILFCTAASQAAVDMTGWTLVNGNWTYTNPTSEIGRLDETTDSGIVGPSWVFSDFVLPATSSFSMTLKTEEPGEGGFVDDDIMGLAFCYQDNDHFYLLDWKKGTQPYNWGDPVSINDDIAEEGIKLKKIDGSWTRDGLWGGTDGIGVSTLDGPTGVGWAFDTDYTFDVDLSPGHIVVRLDGSPLFDVFDSSFQGGRITLYGFSQDNLLFSNVTYVPEPATLSLLGLGSLVWLRKRRA